MEKSVETSKKQKIRPKKKKRGNAVPLGKR
jgi:hypothetical protein